MLAQGDDMIPIPGTKRVARFEENVAAANLRLTPDQPRRIEDAAPKSAVAGDRYADMSMVSR